MTLETKNLLIGMVAGFAFGLVVCSGVHAEPGPIPCDPPRTGMACYLTDTNDDGPSILWDAPRLQTPCERTMAEAMRAMDEFVQERTTTDAILRSPGAVLREAADREDRREAALRHWEAAKACWGPDR